MKATQKARDLIELATKEGGSEKERIVAAVNACKLIKKYDLLASPLDGLLGEIDNEDVQAVGNVLRSFTDPTLVSSIKKIAGQFGKKKARKR